MDHQDAATLTVIGLFFSAFASVGYLYTMVLNLRKEVGAQMDEGKTEFSRRMDILQAMLQADRQLREETRVATERELGKTVKHDDLQRATDRIMGEIRDVKLIAGGNFHQPQRPRN